MKKNGEFVGVDEKFIPENEKYVDESLVEDKEKTKKMAKRFGIGYLLVMCIPIILFVSIAIFMVSRFNNINNRYGNMYTFFHLQGSQSGYELRDYLDRFIANNKAGGYTTITVLYKGKTATTEEEILSIKNEVPNTTTEAYEVSVEYADSLGQVVNKVTIKEI